MYKSRIRSLEERVDALEKKSAPRPVVEINISGMSVGENIKAKRHAASMTQEELAIAVGSGQSMIAQIEQGSKIPNLILGRDTARVLQCDLEELVKE